MSTNLKNDVYNVVCKTCKYCHWQLDAAGDEIDYLCSKQNNKIVDKYDRCNNWGTNFEAVEIPTPTGKPVKIAMNVQKWEKLTSGFTPGGDPAYICSMCQSKESEHIHGVESHTTWNYCPICGTKLEY